MSRDLFILTLNRNKFYSIFIKLDDFFKANYGYILETYITSSINSTKYFS